MNEDKDLNDMAAAFNKPSAVLVLIEGLCTRLTRVEDRLERLEAQKIHDLYLGHIQVPGKEDSDLTNL